MDALKRVLEIARVLTLRGMQSDQRIAASLLSLVGHPRLGRSILAMLRAPEKNWTVATLAAESAMSRATFARHFEACGGVPPHEVLTIVRMHLAMDLLRSGDLKTAAVGARVGYQSESAFGKTFARVMGQTPAGFRRLVEGVSAMDQSVKFTDTEDVALLRKS